MARVKLKALVFACLFISALFAYYYITSRREINAAQEALQKEREKAKAEKLRALDSLQMAYNEHTLTLQNELGSLREQTADLIKRIKTYEKRPDYSLDFLTAADVITKSNYKPER